ncbi:aspartate:alanine exchanger family transporter [Blastopirellula retiformator]|uniref:Aspartate/alanine antiporter n=1 Tax=Blastopirellula retiformator TaxID=2527970 RepID=A0A5C5V353_9BACT|nr:aspartate:alanine exchanger family transporter [Blastopirellula retiformator]TWT32968.1 Aspartate/alanine antiporter [Blastopirellula retiformator]
MISPKLRCLTLIVLNTLAATVLTVPTAVWAAAGDAQAAPAPIRAPAILVLAAVISLGLLLGQVSLFGLTLGSAGVLFVGLVAGHLQLHVPGGTGEIGLAAFVYCVGLGAGPTFFRSLVQDGRSLAMLGAVIVASGATTAWGVGKLLGLPAELAGGVFAGAMTSTPALGALTTAIPDSPDVAVGFGVGYPFGIIGVVAFVQVLPKLLGRELKSSTAGDPSAAATQIVRKLVEIRNPAIVGKRPGGVPMLEAANCQTPRVRDGELLRPTPHDFQFTIGQQVMLVGPEKNLATVMDMLGTEVEGADQLLLDAERQRRHIVVTSPEMVGKSLKELHLLSTYGVTITRIRRYDVEFVPSAMTTIEFGDQLTAVGEPESWPEVERLAGHRPSTLDHSDILSLAIGLLFGIALGMIPVSIGNQSIQLGLAGGPLIVGLILGHFGRLGPIAGHLPRSARMLLMEAGLALFLASAGVSAGGNFVAVLQSQGIWLCVGAAAVAIVPLTVGFLLADFVLKLRLLKSLGAICGGMTSTPGLAAITSATDAAEPVIAYVAAYPIALFLVTILAPILVEMLR